MNKSTAYIIALIMFLIASIWITVLAVVIVKYNIPYPSMPVFMMCIPPIGLYIGVFFTIVNTSNGY